MMIEPGAMILPDGAAAPLRIRLFGPFEAQVNGAPLPRLRTRKGQWLLALLALRAGSELERTWLAGMLWPDRSDSQALALLRRDLTDLRRALGREAGRLSSPTTRALCLDVNGANVDIVAFDRAIAAGDVPSLESAARLYRGPLLEGCVEEWAFEERQSRELAYLGALETLANRALQGGDFALAEHRLRQAVAVDPLRETTQRALMQALAAGGSHSAALQVYRELRLLLHRQTNTEPDAETTALFQQLRAEVRAKAGEREPVTGGVRPRGRIGDAAGRGSDTARPRSGQPEVFPALGNLDVLPHNLPVQPTALIGRENDVAAVKALFREDDARLVTLTGPGGTGKTRLGLRIAAELLDAFAAGVFFVALAPVSDPDRVASTIARVLGVREAGAQPLQEILKRYLREKQMLLLLDNFEHLLAAAPLIAELLAAAPRLKVLVTSRAGLRLRGEKQYPVWPLDLPPRVQSRELRVESSGKVEDGSPLGLSTLNSQLSTLTQYAAVELFIQRTRDVEPEFAVSPENAQAVVEICRRLDGLPLALELAAARMKLFTPPTLLSRLESRLNLLTEGARDSPARQQTLRSAIAWSYDLLTEEERRLFRRSSVFVGGFSLEAAEAVCSGGPEIEVLHGVAGLVDQSLLQRVTGPECPARFTMLETIREFAREQMIASDEAAVIRHRHALYFLQFVQAVAPPQRRSEDRLDVLAADHDNFRAAMDWFEGEGGDSSASLRMAAALWRSWVARGSLTEGRERLRGSLARADQVSVERADALILAGVLAYYQLDYEAAKALLEESLGLWRRLDCQGRMVSALINLGLVVNEQGDHRQAALLAAEALAIARAAGSERLIAFSSYLMGLGADANGDPERAAALCRESVSRFRKSGERWLLTLPLLRLGSVACRQGDWRQADTHFRECLALCAERRNQRHVPASLEGLARVFGARGQWAQAARLHGAAATLRETMGLPLPPADRTDDARHLGQLREILGDAAFTAAWAEGQAMPLDDVVSCAQEERDSG